MESLGLRLGGHTVVECSSLPLLCLVRGFIFPPMMVDRGKATEYVQGVGPSRSSFTGGLESLHSCRAAEMKMDLKSHF